MSGVPFSWSGESASARDRSAPFGLADRYLAVFSVCLFGYALFGKSFAYLGVPPLFIGEAMLGLGLLLAGYTAWNRRGTLTAPLGIALLLLVWCLSQTIPYIPTYGVMALRDVMVVGYTLFGVVAVVLFTARPARLPAMLTRYRVLVVVVCGVAWLLFLISRSFSAQVPMAPWAPGVSLLDNKPGDLLVHLATITAFLVLGFRKPSGWVLVLLVAGTGALMAGNRGGMLGYVLAMGVFAIMKPRSAKATRLIYVFAVMMVVGLAANTATVAINGGTRTLSVGQLWENVKSLAGKSDNAQLDNTVEWRLEWWGIILDYAFFGDEKWTGKGFGRNIATEDGFAVDLQGSLRSPHNVHMTILARSGIPGLALWILLHLAWWASVLRAWLYARRARLYEWQGLFAMCAVFWTAAVVNATFDVYLEGPMGAIWFWFVFGLALAAARLVRTEPTLLDGRGLTPPPRRPRRRPPFPGPGPLRPRPLALSCQPPRPTSPGSPWPPHPPLPCVPRPSSRSGSPSTTGRRFWPRRWMTSSPRPSATSNCWSVTTRRRTGRPTLRASMPPGTRGSATSAASATSG